MVIVWNDVGMHCMDPSFEDFSVLPPNSNLVAQVVKRGSSPQIVTRVSRESRKLSRNSVGYQGIMCSVCNGSTYAIYPSLEPLDNKQSIWLQGFEGTIRKCTVCHTNNPDRGEGPHQDDNDD